MARSSPRNLTPTLRSCESFYCGIASPPRITTPGAAGAAGDGEHVLVGHSLGLGDLSREQQAPDLGHGLARGRIHTIAALARPDGVLVQLNMLVGDLAEHHGAEAAVADRHRLHPLLRGL